MRWWWPWVDQRGEDGEGVSSDLERCRGRPPGEREPSLDRFEPRVDGDPCLLFRDDMLLFEIPVGPPCLSALKQRDGLRHDHVPVALQRLDVDLACREWPKPAIAGRVAEEFFLVSGASEHALPRFEDILSTVGRPVLFLTAGDESLPRLDIAFIERRQLREFDQPLAAQVLRCVLMVDVGHMVAEVFLAREYRKRRRFQRALRAGEDDGVIGLASRPVHPGGHADQKHLADLPSVRGVLRSEISRKHLVDPRLAVPYQAVEPIAERVEAVLPPSPLDRMMHGFETDLLQAAVALHPFSDLGDIGVYD
jgi:hypothetical protein